MVPEFDDSWSEFGINGEFWVRRDEMDFFFSGEECVFCAVFLEWDDEVEFHFR